MMQDNMFPICQTNAKEAVSSAGQDIDCYVACLALQVSLTTSDWDECSSWLTALKRLIKARQMLG